MEQVKVYIWRGSTIGQLLSAIALPFSRSNIISNQYLSVGHAALEIGDQYLSIWPKTHELARRSAIHSCDVEPYFINNYTAEQQKYEEAAHVVYTIRDINKPKLLKRIRWIKRYKQYNIKNYNCVCAVIEALTYGNVKLAPIKGIPIPRDLDIILSQHSKFTAKYVSKGEVVVRRIQGTIAGCLLGMIIGIIIAIFTDKTTGMWAIIISMILWGFIGSSEGGKRLF